MLLTTFLHLYKQALTQERRRYGFVLERQCSLAKHYYSFYNQATNLYEKNIEDWNEVAKTREVLPNKIDKEISNNGQVCNRLDFRHFHLENCKIRLSICVTQFTMKEK